MVYSERDAAQKDTSSSAVTSSLSDLIARLEKATGPDRELDCEIAEALGHSIVWKQANYTMEAFPAILWRKPHPYAGMKEPCPKWTESIDAAMTLVPVGHGWALNYASMASIIRLGPNGAVDGEIVSSWPDNQLEAEQRVTPAIALCIAALRARSLPAI